MVTGAMNILSGLSQTGNTADTGNVKGTGSTKQTKASDSLTFQSMFENTAGEAQGKAVNSKENVINDNVKEPNQKNDLLNSNRPEKLDSAKESNPKDGIEDMYEQIRNIIKENMGISDEELEEALANLSMTMSDLLEPGNVMQLMMELSENDNPLEIITDAQMSEIFKNVNSEIADVVSATAEKLNISEEKLYSFAEAYDEAGMSEQETQTVYVQTENVNENLEKNPENETKQFESNTGKESEAESPNEIKHTDSGANTMEQVVQRLDNTVREVFATSESTMTGDVDMENILRQINEAVRVNMSDTSTSMELQLNPESLGKVSIQVVAKNGVITANIATQDEAVRRAVEAQVVSLKETLNNQGIKVEAVEVTIASHSFERNDGRSNDGNGSSDRRGRRIRLEDDVQDDGKDDMQQELSEESTVSYRA